MSEIVDRFFRYVQINTEADPAANSFPSSARQLDLSRLLVSELHELGLADAHLDEYGYVYATVPPSTSKQNVPVICFCSHVDTSPDVTGAGVKPILHPNWRGEDIVLPDDPTQVIRLAEHPDLAEQFGSDIITASGTTLLGADNKAGVAAIMTAVAHLVRNPNLRHGPIRILFTPDEEIGRGTDYVNIEKLGAYAAYTVDGERRGTLEDETFSADAVQISIQGVSAHPGFAKNKLENALKIAGDILNALPKDRLSPETTEEREGFIHPVRCIGTQDSATLDFIIRDFSEEGLAALEQILQEITAQVLSGYPNSTSTFRVTPQYRNMKQVLDAHPEVVEYALLAIERAGMRPIKRAIRGGTDGSRLSFMGLPCPNIFAGEHAFHSRLEWVSVQDMEKAAETLVQLAQIWEEKTAV